MKALLLRAPLSRFGNFRRDDADMEAFLCLRIRHSDDGENQISIKWNNFVRYP